MESANPSGKQLVFVSKLRYNKCWEHQMTVSNFLPCSKVDLRQQQQQLLLSSITVVRGSIQHCNGGFVITSSVVSIHWCDVKKLHLRVDSHAYFCFIATAQILSRKCFAQDATRKL